MILSLILSSITVTSSFWIVLDVYCSFFGASWRYSAITGSVSALKHTSWAKLPWLPASLACQSILLSLWPRRASPCLPQKIVIFKRDSITFSLLSMIRLTYLLIATSGLIWILIACQEFWHSSHCIEVVVMLGMLCSFTGGLCPVPEWFKHKRA